MLWGEEELSKPSYKASALNATSQYCYPIFHLKETESLDFDMNNSFQDIFDYYAPYLPAPSKYGAMPLGQGTFLPILPAVLSSPFPLLPPTTPPG